MTTLSPADWPGETKFLTSNISIFSKRISQWTSGVFFKTLFLVQLLDFEQTTKIVFHIVY